MKKLAVAALGFLFLTLVGCLSAPIPQELTDFATVAPPQPLTIQEVVRLSKAGLSRDVIVEQIRKRGIADRPPAAEISALERQGVDWEVRLILLASSSAPPPPPQPRIITRELFIPLWPSFAGGRWRFGVRIAFTCRSVESEPKESTETKQPEKTFVDP